MSTKTSERDELTRPEDQRHRELLAGIVSGDEDALEDLYDCFDRALYGVGMRMLNDPQLAEELVQDTIMKVWRGASAFDASRGNVSAWIFTIAKRSAIDAYRRGRRAPVPVAGDDRVEDAGTQEDEPWRVWQVGVLLRELPSDQREVVELGVIEGFTHVEIAERLQIPLGTVKTRIYAGLRRLREQLLQLELLEASS